MFDIFRQRAVVWSNIFVFVVQNWVSVVSEFVLSSTMANAAGFQFYSGPHVTVLSSKTSQRYRLQSDNLPALWVVIQTLEARLSRHFGDSKLDFSYSSSLPLHEYFGEIEAHFLKR